MLKKNFSNINNTVETFGNIIPQTNCGCDPDCNCSCQSNMSKSATKKNTTRDGDYAAKAKVQKW